MTGQWLAQQTSNSDVHVLPLDDHIVHDHHDACPCGPIPQLEPRPGQADAWIHVHHSLDGREHHNP